jgi:hypothetical protein
MVTEAQIDDAFTNFTDLAQVDEKDKDAVVDAATDVSAAHKAKFCAIWNVAGPVLDELKQVIPGVGPLIIGMLERIGNKVYAKHGCGN